MHIYGYERSRNIAFIRRKNKKSNTVFVIIDYSVWNCLTKNSCNAFYVEYITQYMM